MRRVVQPFRIIFVDRQLGWSLLCFGSSLVAILMAGSAFERQHDATSGLVGVGASIAASGLFAAAFWMLFRKRAFIINRNGRSLTVLERSLFGRSELHYPLESIRVRVEQWTTTHSRRGGSYDHTEGAIWLDVEGHRCVRFMSDLHGPEAKILGTQLAEDLGCPLHCE